MRSQTQEAADAMVRGAWSNMTLARWEVKSWKQENICATTRPNGQRLIIERVSFLLRRFDGSSYNFNFAIGRSYIWNFLCANDVTV